MACHEVDIRLGILVHASPFGDYVADVLMVFLQPSFLIGYIGVAVKDFCPKRSGVIPFNTPRILKFRPVVGQKDREILSESTYPYGIAKVIDGITYALLRAVRKEYDDHKAAASEQKSKQALSGGAASFYRIHLDNTEFGERFGILLKVNVGTLMAVFLRVGMAYGFTVALALFIPDPAWKIDVSGGKDTLIKVVVQSSPADGDLVSVYGKDVAERLPLHHQR